MCSAGRYALACLRCVVCASETCPFADPGKLELNDEERDQLAEKMGVILSYYCSVRSVEYRPGYVVVQGFKRVSSY